ncbi:MAG: hypothetical protein J7K58_05400 [Euryarchaeota archaeon]|nr:hypothetical protein [Euryarchaeota archaeon]
MLGVHVFSLLMLLIVSTGYINGSVESIAGGDTFGVFLTSSMDVLIMERFEPIDLLTIAPEKGSLIVSNNNIFILGRSGLYIFNNKTLSFDLVFNGSVDANKYYAVYNGVLYKMPRLKPLGHFNRVLIRESLALGFRNSVAYFYERGHLVAMINLSGYDIDYSNVVDFLYTSDGVSLIQEYKRVTFILNTDNGLKVHEINYSTPRALRVLYFNKSYAYILLKSRASDTGVSRYIVAVYSFHEGLFVRYMFSHRVYFPYVFINSDLINVLDDKIVFSNVLSVLDYSCGKLLLVLKNNTIVLLDITKNTVRYSRGLQGVPYLGAIVGNASAVLVLRVAKNYSYAYMIEFSTGYNSQQRVPRAPSEGTKEGFPMGLILLSLLFYAFIVIVVILALKKK